MGSKGIVASSAALGVLLQQGIGDTIRISLTPEPGGDRTLEPERIDGDVVPEQALSASPRELELWKRISDETGRRRRMVTPAYISSQILKKLADD